jgi:hypothetical protein
VVCKGTEYFTCNVGSGIPALTHFGRITSKAAWVTLLLLFALRAIAAPDLCAAQDAVSESYRAQAGIAEPGPASTANVSDFSISNDQKPDGPSDGPLGSGVEDYCHNPAIADDAAMAFATAEPSHQVDLAPALQRGVRWPEPAIVGAVLRLSLSPPRVKWSALDIAPRLRI